MGVRWAGIPPQWNIYHNRARNYLFSREPNCNFISYLKVLCTETSTSLGCFAGTIYRYNWSKKFGWLIMLKSSNNSQHYWAPCMNLSREYSRKPWDPGPSLKCFWTLYGERALYQISIIIIMIYFEPCMFLYSELCILVCSSESYRILGFNP